MDTKTEGNNTPTPEALAALTEKFEASTPEQRAEVKGEQPKSESKSEPVKSWSEQGKAAGLKIAALLEKGENVMRETLLHFAALIAGSASAMDWLNGYAEAFTQAQTKMNRKSEAKAVFAAFASNHKVSRVDLRDEVAEQQRELAKKGEPPMKREQTTREWLLEYRGGYHGFIKLARELAPRETDKSTKTGTTRAKTQMADGLHQKACEEIQHATLKQTDDLMLAAIKHAAKMPSGDAHLIGQLIAICNEIKATSKNDALIDGVSEILDLVHGLGALMVKAPVATLPTPAPAQAPASNNAEVNVELRTGTNG